MTTAPRSPNSQLILQPKAPAEVSQGAGLGDLVSAEVGRERLARYATECARLDETPEGKGAKHSPGEEVEPDSPAINPSKAE